MKRLSIALAAMLAVLPCAPVSAATPLPAAPAGQVYCYDSAVAGPTYNGVRAQLSCSTTPPPPPAAGQMLRATITYPTCSGASCGNNTRVNADVTVMENIVGHANSTDAGVVWPGRGNTSIVIKSVPYNGCISARFFASPASAYSNTGRSTYGTASGIRVASSISTAPCSVPLTVCSFPIRGAGEQFGRVVVRPHTNGCALTAGQLYFQNWFFVDAPSSPNRYDLGLISSAGSQP